MPLRKMTANLRLGRTLHELQPPSWALFSTRSELDSSLSGSVTTPVQPPPANGQETPKNKGGRPKHTPSVDKEWGEFERYLHLEEALRRKAREPEPTAEEAAQAAVAAAVAAQAAATAAAQVAFAAQAAVETLYHC